jgi:indole-3-glycerol phosphate synthase
MSVLERICTDKAAHVKESKAKISFEHIHNAARKAKPAKGFETAIRAKNADGKPAVIAEVKKASPSKGLISDDFDPVKTAQHYQENGAACISVLTDTPYFQGSDADFLAARKVTDIPMIRKDFMVDPYQIVESRAMGADCILIIMAALSDVQAAELVAAAREYKLDILFETHNSEEIERTLPLNPTLIGVNSRNLKTLDVDIAMFDTLYDTLPHDCLKIAESGIQSTDTIKTLYSSGYNGFLIGESFMRNALNLSEI